MESLRTMGREWAGPRIGTPHTGSRTEERFRRWRSRSILSGKSKLRPAQDSRNLRLSGTKTQKPGTNKACPRQVGVGAIFRQVSDFEFFLLPNRVHARPGLVVELVETHSPMVGRRRVGLLEVVAKIRIKDDWRHFQYRSIQTGLNIQSANGDK